MGSIDETTEDTAPETKVVMLGPLAFFGAYVISVNAIVKLIRWRKGARGMSLKLSLVCRTRRKAQAQYKGIY